MKYYIDNKPILAWHGANSDGTTQYLKFKEFVGVKSSLTGDIVLCGNALHGSVKAVDMLNFGKGLWFKRTLHEGVIFHDEGKIGSSERTVIAEADATQVVSDWAFWCADRAVRIHAVAALESAGMSVEAKKLSNLATIMDIKSANAACVAAYAAYIVANAAYAVFINKCNSTVPNVNAHTCCVAHVSRATCAAFYAADYTAAYTVTDCAAVCADYTACAAAHTLLASTNNATVSQAAYIAESDLVNAKLEQQLFHLMGITETEGLG